MQLINLLLYIIYYTSYNIEQHSDKSSSSGSLLRVNYTNFRSIKYWTKMLREG